MNDQAITAEHAEYAEAEEQGKRIPVFFPRGPRIPRSKDLEHFFRLRLRRAAIVVHAKQREAAKS